MTVSRFTREEKFRGIPLKSRLLTSWYSIGLDNSTQRDVGLPLKSEHAQLSRILYASSSYTSVIDNQPERL